MTQHERFYLKYLRRIYQKAEFHGMLDEVMVDRTILIIISVELKRIVRRIRALPQGQRILAIKFYDCSWCRFLVWQENLFDESDVTGRKT